MNSIFRRIKNKCSIIYWNQRFKLDRGGNLKKIIVFESAPDLADNTRAVFDEMIRRKINRQYKLVFLLYASETAIPSHIPNVYQIPQWHPRAKLYKKTARAIICCNRFIEKSDDRQLCIYLSHGTGLKDTRSYYRLPAWFDYCIAASPDLEESHAEGLSFNRDKTVGLGFPRNDALCNNHTFIKDMLNTSCRKVVVWYPTYRQHQCDKSTPVVNPIPLLDDLECAKKLNDAAMQADTLIVIKPHFAQNTQYIKEMNLSNIRFIDDDFFKENHILSYEFVGACDALITDYSSIYFDYTLCDKPIAGIWSDIEEYKKKPGLVDGYEELCKGMEKVYTLDDFIAFIYRVGSEIDLLQNERRSIRDYANFPADSSNSSRVVDFIMKQIAF